MCIYIYLHIYIYIHTLITDLSIDEPVRIISGIHILLGWGCKGYYWETFLAYHI